MNSGPQGMNSIRIFPSVLGQANALIRNCKCGRILTRTECKPCAAFLNWQHKMMFDMQAVFFVDN